jgi:Uma2 family endonuclease
MGATAGPCHGPYTLYDLHALPEEGRRHELFDGWLTELPGDLWHDHAAGVLREILRAAVLRADTDAHITGAPREVVTGAGVRRPDVFVVSRSVARSALERQSRAYYGPDLLLVVEVVTPRTASERADRVGKVTEYAASGIPHYWIVDLEPRPAVTVLELVGADYRVDCRAGTGERLALGRPFPVTFDPARLAEMD